MSVVAADDSTQPTTKPARARRNRLSIAFTCDLALFLLLNAFVLNSVLRVAAPEDYRETVLDHASDVLHADGCDDSWGIMSFAWQYSQAPHATPLYTEIFFNRRLKFQYPLSSLFTIAAMLKVAGPAHVRTAECDEFNPASLNDVLGWLFILLSAVSAAVLLEIGLRKKFGAPSPAALVVARVAVVGVLAMTFYPVVKAFTLGQIQIWLNGIFAVALVCWVTGKKVSSGVLIGLMCLVKPHYGLFLLWGALRREWRFTVACVGMLTFGLVASLAVFGWTDNVDYLQVFWFLSQRGEVYYPNQSFNGLLNRLMVLIDPARYDSIGFDDNSFPPFNVWIYSGTLLTSLIIVSAALLRRGTEGDPDRTFDFCTMALSTTIASPIAWEHHYGILFPVFAVLLAASLGNRTRLVLLAICYVLISNFFPVANMLAESVFNVGQSYLFFAALVVLLMLHTLRPGWQFAAFPSPSSALSPQVR